MREHFMMNKKNPPHKGVASEKIWRKNRHNSIMFYQWTKSEKMKDALSEIVVNKICSMILGF